MAIQDPEGDKSPLVEDLSVRNAPRRGGTYHRLVDSLPVVNDGTLYTEDGEVIQRLKGKQVKIEAERLVSYYGKSEEQSMLYHIYVRDEEKHL